MSLEEGYIGVNLKFLILDLIHMVNPIYKYYINIIYNIYTCNRVINLKIEGYFNCN